MTPAAWGMLLITWSIVTFYTVKYFWMVLVLPEEPADADAAAQESQA